VQFRRKTTFDAGATPGLEDFERPDLKSVSGDLVDELRSISDEKERRESELADLRQELEKKEHRIAELEGELEEARDLRRFADQMAQAMFQTAEAPYRGGQGRNLARPDERQRALEEYEDGTPGSANGTDDAGEMSAEPTPTDAEAVAAADKEAAVNAAASADPDADLPFPPATDPEMTDDGAGATNGEPSGPTRIVQVAPDGDADADTDADAGTDGDVRSSDGTSPPLPDGDVGVVAGTLRERLAEFDAVTRRMLAHYHSQGIADPVTAQVAAGGPGDHKVAYARNRTLRKAGFVRHAGRGKYAYALPDHVRTEYAHRLNPDAFDEAVEAVEAVFTDGQDDARDTAESEPSDDVETAAD
jgi:hypothetical protein